MRKCTTITKKYLFCVQHYPNVFLSIGAELVRKLYSAFEDFFMFAHNNLNYLCPNA